MANNEAEKITPSFDWEDSRFSEAVALMPQSIRHIIEENSVKGIIPVPNVSAQIYSMVIEYCKKHVATDDGNTHKSDKKLKKWDELKEWDEKFIDIDLTSLYEIMLAANYLDIEGLLDLAFKKLVNMIKGKNSEEIRRIFNIENNFTPKKVEEILLEEEEIRHENQRALEWISNLLSSNNM